MEIESDSECIHGLGPVAACVICNGREEKEKKQDQIVRNEDGQITISFDYD